MKDLQPVGVGCERGGWGERWTVLGVFRARCWRSGSKRAEPDERDKETCNRELGRRWERSMDPRRSEGAVPVCSE